jgi:CDP-diacylglycerol--serine O-phosphatidyltransferase
MPAFLVPCAGAYRLARFNIDTEQSYGFKGVPIPAVGLLIASFPLIYLYSNEAWKVLCNHWFWDAVILIVSYLMVSKLPMLALKFKNATIKSFLPFIILAVIAIISAIIVRWIAVPITFAAYVILSLVFKQNKA